MIKPIQKPGDIPYSFAKAWNDRDAQGIADLFFDNAEFVNVVGLWWHKKKDILKAHDYGLRTIFNKSTIRVTRVKIKQLTQEVTIVHAKMHLTGQTAVGGVSKPEDRHNIFSFVAQKTDGGWLCASAHNTDIIPGAETNIITEGKVESANYRGLLKK